MENLTLILEWLEDLDHKLIIFINGMNHPIMDKIMWWVSNKFVWFPLYIFLFILVYVKYSLRKALLFTLFGFVAVGLADYTATFIFKESVARYRPSHNLELSKLLHFYEFKPGEFYKGGQYGFVSGHATNSFVIALMFIQRLWRDYKWITPLLIIWACLVSYSRIYLGVHYPSDIIGGAILGMTISLVMYLIYLMILSRINDLSRSS